MTEEILEVYIDTSALRGMSFNREVATLLSLSAKGIIRVYLSETTLWERGRQQYERDFSGDRVVPYPDGINRYLAWFKALFEKYGVIIIPSDTEITDLAATHLQSSESYFSPDVENDQRDAHVLATAEIKTPKKSLILCHDNNLADTFENISGFVNVRKDFKNFLLELVGDSAESPNIEKPSLDSLDDVQIASTFSESFRGYISEADHRFHEYLKTLPEVTDKLTAKLANMQLLDAEIRKRILGYTQWFDPITKNQLNELLGLRHYNNGQILTNVERLRDEGLIVETEHCWMTNNQDPEVVEICEQAMSVVMTEIIEMLELD